MDALNATIHAAAEGKNVTDIVIVEENGVIKVKAFNQDYELEEEEDKPGFWFTPIQVEGTVTFNICNLKYRIKTE